MKEDRERAKKQLIDELSAFEKANSQVGRLRVDDTVRKTAKVIKMPSFMGEHYNDLKSAKGIDRESYLRVDKTDMPKVESVFQHRNPDCDAKNFREYLEFEKKLLKKKR